MKIERIVVGELETNCYLLIKDEKVLAIDPGDEADKIFESIKSREVQGVVVTHRHFDHVGALEELLQWTKSEVYDFSNLEEGKVTIGDFSFEVIYTPGHKEDSICLYFEEDSVMFTGDFIFKGTIGRWDLSGGSYVELMNSIKKILSYPQNVVLYPGHGDVTTLKDEKDNLENYLKRF